MVPSPALEPARARRPRLAEVALGGLPATGSRTAGADMNSKRTQAFAGEIALARTRLREGGLDQAMRHLERAHVLGQDQVGPHVLSHWLMLRVALRRAEPMAAAGQLVRIALGALGSAVGRVPTGNTGGSDVNMFRPMPIPADLLELMRGGDQGEPGVP